MLDLSKIQNKKLPTHQLNNEGCRCQMCQKVVKEQTMKIVKEVVVDSQSEAYSNQTKEYYLKLVRMLVQWDSKYNRKLRYLLPEICAYENFNPVELIFKRRETGSSKLVHDKAKMHMFEVIQFFLEGFVHHNPEPTSNSGKKKGQNNFVFGTYSEKYKNECMVLAKYRNNTFKMFTFDQMESLFKSRYKNLREGLISLQTIVGTKNYKEIRINIEIRKLMEENREMYERAKNEARVFLEEVKPSDMDYVHEQEEIAYENNLKRNDITDYLEYLTLKIILISSKNDPQIISQGTFKYIHNRNMCYLWDVRVKQLSSTEEFWATGVMKAFQLRLKKRMDMMDDQELPPIMMKSQTEMQFSSLGKKARDVSAWLESSTSLEWEQMKVIRNRLQRLEKEKKSLIQSQSYMEGGNNSGQSKIFKVRTLSQANRKQ